MGAARRRAGHRSRRHGGRASGARRARARNQILACRAHRAGAQPQSRDPRRVAGGARRGRRMGGQPRALLSDRPPRERKRLRTNRRPGAEALGHAQELAQQRPARPRLRSDRFRTARRRVALGTGRDARGEPALQPRDPDPRLRGRKELLPARRAARGRARRAGDRAARGHRPQGGREAPCGRAGDQARCAAGAPARGARVDALPAIESSAAQPIPAGLSGAVDRLIDVALQERPDLAAAIATVREREAAVDLARASLYPTVEFSSYYGSHAFNYTLSNPPTPQFTALAPEYAAGLAVHWDAFAGFEHVNTIVRAEAERDAARADFYRGRLDVASEVWRAYYAFTTALRKYQYAQALLRASQSAYDSNFGSYRNGLATIVDLLSAERDLADAKYTLVGSRAEVLIAAASVAYATGAIPQQARP